MSFVPSVGLDDVCHYDYFYYLGFVIYSDDVCADASLAKKTK